jgi:hypothetical protein
MRLTSHFIAKGTCLLAFAALPEVAQRYVEEYGYESLHFAPQGG